jgi:hypothetical protein
VPRGGVQPGGFRSGEGDHAGLLPIAEALPPVAHLGGVGFRLGAAHDHLAVRHQPIEGLVLPARAEQGGDLLAKGRLLAVVAAQLAGTQAEAEGAERAAGVDGSELPVVADHDHLASGPLGMMQEAGELAGADHGRLIQYHHGVTVEPFVASV